MTQDMTTLGFDQIIHQLQEQAVSMERPVCAMEDESAIFIKDGKVDIIGIIHRIDQEEIGPFTAEDVRL